MFHSKAKERKVTPPSPSYMDSKQFANYLAELRNNRVNRPGGARPQPRTISRPERTRLSVDGLSSGTVPSSEVETASVPPRTLAEASMPQLSQVPSLARTSPGRPSLNGSISSRYSTISQGRDYIPERPAKPLDPSEVVPSATYIERGQRWMEKEEAFSLRRAMEDMDVQDEVKQPEGDEEDQRIYSAALNEAAELVWQHQNPGKVPQPGTPYRHRPHLRKNSYAYARTASAGLYGEDVEPTGLARDSGSRSVSASSSSSNGFATSVRSRSSSGRASAFGDHAGRPSLDGSPVSGRTPSGPSGPRGPPKSYGNLANGRAATMQGHRRRSSLKRDISGEVQKPFSGDQIWEEPEVQTPEKNQAKVTEEGDGCLGVKATNPLNRVSFAAGMPTGEDSGLPCSPKLVSRSEIHRNPPSQSRNPQYTTNQASSTPLAKCEDESVPRKHGVEIRSDDIRQATSMRLKDRSPKLPMPSAVSDNPGRPIVSFDRDWKPPEEATDVKPEEKQKTHQASAPSSGAGGTICGSQSRSPFARRAARGEQQRQQPQQTPPPESSSSPRKRPQPTAPSIQVDGPCVDPSMPSIPVISVCDIDPTPARPSMPSIPTIVLPGDHDFDDGPSIPVIVTPDHDNNNKSTKSTTESKTTAARPLPTPQSGGRAQRSRSHWSPAPGPTGSRATARCHECGYFIEGRFVSLAGMNERFHPACFRCYTCGTALEALEISPEPETHRAARLARVAARAAGETLPHTIDEDGTPAPTAEDDGDARLRFYCHLDWHEQFAPRCAHCRTPILGASVVALGRHWHEDHFFCAECGDPFKPGATHIEKDGYAWCLTCQTRRTERRAPKCRGCRGPVIGQYVRALGGEWHDACFRCATCAGTFDDGQIFPVEGRGVLCTGCRERELKAF